LQRTQKNRYNGLTAYSVLDGVMATAATDFIYNRNKDLDKDVIAVKLDKNGCYI